jgi:hypothetical protein
MKHHRLPPGGALCGGGEWDGAKLKATKQLEVNRYIRTGH